MALASSYNTGDTLQDVWTALTNVTANSAPLGTYAATGSTLAGGPQITTRLAVLTNATASTQGVRLPAPVTGAVIDVVNRGTFGVKVYPGPTSGAGYTLDSSATSAAVVIATLKANRYVGISTTKWVTFKGA